MASAVTSRREHNRKCAEAEGFSCSCKCGNSGHGMELLRRCLKCAGPGSADFSDIAQHLREIYGVFHRDPSTDQRPFQRGREQTQYMPPPSLTEMTTGIRAKRFETVVLDDTVHDILLRTAQTPGTSSWIPFFEDITEAAVEPMTTVVTVSPPGGSSVANPHVWCALSVGVAQNWQRVATRRNPTPPDYEAIAYPRQAAVRYAAPLADPTVRATALRIFYKAIAKHSAAGTPPSTIFRVLNLVALRSCIDVWRHPGIVRYVLFGMRRALPAPTNLVMANHSDHLNEIRDRWQMRSNW